MYTVHSSEIAYEGSNRGYRYKCRVNNTTRALFRTRDALREKEGKLESKSVVANLFSFAAFNPKM